MKRIDMWVIQIKYTDNNKIVLAESKPCTCCLKVIKKYGISRIWYSTNKGTIECKKTQDIKTKHVSSYSRIYGEPVIKLK
jgi:deoxycytidylate deaminase